MRNFSDKIYREKKLSIIPPLKTAFREIMWKNMLQPGSSQMTVYFLESMNFAYLIPKATNSFSE
jgi:hypothetical protein